MTQSLRIAFVGSVNTSRTTLESLVAHGMGLVGVLQLDAAAAKNVSGFAPLADLAEQADAPCLAFAKVNEQRVVSAVRDWQPDLLFVVGLSQLVGQELLTTPRIGCVGFHPTLLPHGRGRAPIAWLALGETRGAATFFLMDEGTDSGPILVQEPFDVADDDYATDIEQHVMAAIRRALDRWLPQLKAGHWDPQPQDEAHANYLGRRGREDGLIDWHAPASEIARLVRAAARPFPGAYTYVKSHRLIIWRASVVEDIPIHGVIGRILQLDGKERPIVQTGRGHLRIEEHAWHPVPDAASPPDLRPGLKFGYTVEDEIYRLRRKLAELEGHADPTTYLPPL